MGDKPRPLPAVASLSLTHWCFGIDRLLVTFRVLAAGGVGLGWGGRVREGLMLSVNHIHANVLLCSLCLFPSLSLSLSVCLSFSLPLSQGLVTMMRLNVVRCSADIFGTND